MWTTLYLHLGFTNRSGQATKWYLLYWTESTSYKLVVEEFGVAINELPA